jgi:hypothetical protein
LVLCLVTVGCSVQENGTELQEELEDEEELAQLYVVAVVQCLVGGLALFAVFIMSMHLLGFKVWMQSPLSVQAR